MKRNRKTKHNCLLLVGVRKHHSGFCFVQRRRSVRTQLRRRVMHVYKFRDNCMEIHVLFCQCITDTIHQTHMPDMMKESLSIWFNPRLCLCPFPVTQSTFFIFDEPSVNYLFFTIKLSFIICIVPNFKISSFKKLSNLLSL